MKKLFSTIAVMATVAAVPLSVYADDKDDQIAKLEKQVEEMQATIDDLEARLAKYSQSASDKEFYEIGDSWIVEGQWKVTIDSVEETTERNEYSDYDPAAVYIVTYTYENLGYDDDIMDGLYIDFYDGIVDNGGKMGYPYPGDITFYPTETPVGAVCEAQSCIGVDNAGDFKIHFSTYDSNEKKQSAVFSLIVE